MVHSVVVKGWIELERRSTQDRVAVGLAQWGERGLGLSNKILEGAR